MGNSVGRLAGILAFVLALLRLGRLLESGADAPSWEMIMIAAAFLGGVVWWLLSQMVVSRRVALSVFAVVGLLLFLRISVPYSLVGGFLPGPETPGALSRELTQAMAMIRNGVAPVFPISGVVAILALLMWAVGGLFVWGASTGPNLAMVLPSLVVYLQFAVMDRVPGGRGWMAGAALAMALGLASIAVERRQEAGRVRDRDGRPLPRRSGGVTVMVALLVAAGSVILADRAHPLVPETGNVSWRVGSGYGTGPGGVRFDRLADLQQRIIRRSDTVLFRATLGEGAPPPNQVYWRMESLDVFDGAAWRPAQADLPFYNPNRAGGPPDHAYRGSLDRFTQRVQIAALRSEVVPIAGIAQLVVSDTINVASFQLAGDGSLIYQPELGEGDEYQAEAILPDVGADLAALATLPNGQLSPLFRNAVDDGAMSLDPVVPETDRTPPADIERWLTLPEAMSREIFVTAREETAGATTPFEAAWLLQYWFRDSGEFGYSTDVTTGHSSLDLAAWLGDDASINYRTGYCEQFASAMAVLGRALGIPSRVVWGFTPGTVEPQSDGTEVIVVRDRNAHAWVEMWINGFGWVRFDPTPRGDGALPESVTAAFDPAPYLPPPDVNGPRTVDQPGFADEETPRFSIDETDNPVGSGETGGGVPWWPVPIVVAVGALGSIPALKTLRRARRIRRVRSGDITAAWDEIVDRLTDLGRPVPPHLTPMEVAGRTDLTLVSLAAVYSAAVYGEQTGADGGLERLGDVERWMRIRFDPGDRLRAALSPRSLLTRR